ncbi:radical SAM/Cys-rich domain protein [Pontibacter diazotrophicus]|uniref:Radical SAM/Cys-rich domain protein n=1 Tax=Pontibacter diazotrophicus TaxID=1400979 RepID=A0A3D8LFL0_9BACT|nr:arsenosugar biosynthesis radical SAM (seleno)protein ArsS [Pontibacter diazotrophicus]RDV16205.1 radical SAM/Cys-rich domain protein [Pontibacter diazotrophicus]
MGSTVKSLKGRQHELSDSLFQLNVLQAPTQHGEQFPAFARRLQEHDLYPLKPTGTTILQVNMGKMCNQTCKHCHVDAGPDRKEIMTRETMQLCLDALQQSPGITTVDLTGGAPEMNPDFRWFVEELFKLGRQVMVRCNLTIILANKKYHDLPEFFKKHGVHVVSSLPYFQASRTDAQRGDGVFEKSIKALQMLNGVGYGQEGSDLLLDLVYNPSGAFLPSAQASLEAEFKRRLRSGYSIEFHNLFCITNLPVSRFLDYLVQSGNYDSYMEKLVNAFNPVAAAGVMCRNTISVGWDGYLYDCDFNQMLELKVEQGSPQHIRDFDAAALDERNVVLNQHCYGCTAGAGSSCGGETVK